MPNTAPQSPALLHPDHVPASSPKAQRALALVRALQARFAAGLDALSAVHGSAALSQTAWARDEGRHGGGARFFAAETGVFNRAAINVSGVHYDDMHDRRLSSANALSTIIHPAHPGAPSVHMHFSYTEMRDGTGYWRLMADLNPATGMPGRVAAFDAPVRAAFGAHAGSAAEQGARYFEIPALGRTRGAVHYYLEGHDSGDFDADAAFCAHVAETAIDTYLAVLTAALDEAGPASAQALAQQRAYHTLYAFQVLTLDRGTTSGLLVHDQNDAGIMGSLPSVLDPVLFRSWATKVAPPQHALVEALADVMAAAPARPEGAHMTDEARCALAAVVRAHYTAHPEALKQQATGGKLVPTVQNHGAPG